MRVSGVAAVPDYNPPLHDREWRRARRSDEPDGNRLSERVASSAGGNTENHPHVFRVPHGHTAALQRV
jgi:hypothetical protein